MPTVTITMNASRDGVTNRDAEEGSVVGDKVTGPHPIPGTTALNRRFGSSYVKGATVGVVDCRLMS